MIALRLIGCNLVCRENGAQKQPVAKLPRYQHRMLALPAKTCRLRSINSAQHLSDRKVHIVHVAEHSIVQPVQTDGHTLEPGIFECLGFFCQQRCVAVKCPPPHLPATAEGGAYYRAAQYRPAAR